MRICKNCGAQINDNEKFCSSCGQKIEEASFGTSEQSNEQSNTDAGAMNYNQNIYYQPQNQPTSGMAVASLVLGIVGIFISWFTLLVPSILGIIFGAVAIKQCSEKNLNGRGMAIGGLVCSLIIVVIAVIAIIAAIALGSAVTFSLRI